MLLLEKLAAAEDDAVEAVATDVETADSVRRELNYVDDGDDVCYFSAWYSVVASQPPSHSSNVVVVHHSPPHFDRGMIVDVLVCVVPFSAAAEVAVIDDGVGGSGNVVHHDAPRSPPTTAS